MSYFFRTSAASCARTPWRRILVAGLLRFFAHAIESGAPPSLVDSFLVMGGECNYLLRAHVDVAADGLDPRVRLEEVDARAWKDGRGVRWKHSAVARLLDSAEGCLKRCAEQLELDVLIIRKERAVGIIADPSAGSAPVPGAYGGTRLTYEVRYEGLSSVRRGAAQPPLVRSLRRSRCSSRRTCRQRPGRFRTAASTAATTSFLI